jgi:hypothetical protein
MEAIAEQLQKSTVATGASDNRALPAVQLSHDEFLTLLGLLRLPLPIALGDDPLEEYADDTLDAALASAMSSLMAREYVLELPSDTTPTHIQPELADLVAASALADSCLMAAANDESQHTMHYSVRNQRAIVHSSPHERVHRLAWLGGPETIVYHVLATIGPHDNCAAALAFSVAADALGEAVDLANAGQPAAAHDTLLAADVPAAESAAFGERLGTQIARYALVAVRNLQGAHPLADSVVILHGMHEDWYVEDDATRADHVRVSAVDRGALHSKLADLVTTMAAH